MNVDELLAKAKKPAADAMRLHPFGTKLEAADNVTVLKNSEVVEVKGDEFARKLVIKD